MSVPTVEALFSTKARLLKAAVDVAIAGDDEPVPVLDRPWADEAGKAGSLGEFLSMVAGALAAAQQRSAGLVLAVFEDSSRDAELQGLREQMVTQREVTAAWIVRGIPAWRRSPWPWPGRGGGRGSAVDGSGRIDPADPAAPVGRRTLPALDR